jgi:Endonuclease/Exonuclease/phosphatase family
MLLAVLTVALLVRPDFAAAAFFIPTWIWVIICSALASFGIPFHRRISLVILVAWALFSFLFVEEISSFGRYVRSPSRLETLLKNREGRLVVVSLNCAGGASKAAEQLEELKPDIVLLQERPMDLMHVREMADRICGPDSIMVTGDDTVVIAKGVLLNDNISTKARQFAAHAHIKTLAGTEVSIYSVRLQPPEIDTNIFSLDCWTAHQNDRIARRLQLQKVIDDLDTLSSDRNILFGGDFNVSAHDGSLRNLNKRLSDCFNHAGFGNGNTATNWIPLFRIDQIWSSRAIKPTIVSARKSLLSDHRIVVAVFEAF